MIPNATMGLQIVYRAISELKASPHNPRTHSKRQIKQIVESLKKFGWTNPILIDCEGNLIAGHGRLEASKQLGYTSVPTIVLEDLSPDEIRTYIITDNRLAELAGWDFEILKSEFEYLLTLDGVLDVTLTGFEYPEIDQILLENEVAPEQEDNPEDFAGPVVTKAGDLWHVGRHRILCASALDQSSYTVLLGTRKANLVFSDPPYNVPIPGNVSGKGRIRHGDFVMGSGEMNDAEFLLFLGTSLRFMAQHTTSGSIHYICMDWRHVHPLLTVGNQVYSELLNLCVWAKDRGGMGSLYRSAHELVFVFKNGKGKHRNNVQLGTFGRDRTNVWRYPSASTFSRQGDEGNLLALHPTVKPVAMIADAILDCSARGDIVLDAFLGSGSTLIAAERVGRMCCGIELDPRYVDVAIRRWEKHTGDKAVHGITGELFCERAVKPEEVVR